MLKVQKHTKTVLCFYWWGSGLVSCPDNGEQIETKSDLEQNPQHETQRSDFQHIEHQMVKKKEQLQTKNLRTKKSFWDLLSQQNARSSFSSQALQSCNRQGAAGNRFRHDEAQVGFRQI